MTAAVLTMKSGLEATLDSSGRWSCVDSDWQVSLNRHFGPDRYPPSPAAGIFPVAGQARAAAGALGIEVLWAPSGAPAIEGVVH